MFQNDNITLKVLQWSNRLIHCCIQYEDEASKWYLVGVYYSTYYKDKHHLWNELYALHDQIEKSWLILGDFNALLNSFDKSRDRDIGNSHDEAFIGL